VTREGLDTRPGPCSRNVRSTHGTAPHVRLASRVPGSLPVTLTAEDISRATGEPLLGVQRWLKAAFGPAPRGHHRRVPLDVLAQRLAVTPEALAGLLGAEREAA